jgi:aminotransferase
MIIKETKDLLVCSVMHLASRISSIPKSGIREIFDLATERKNVINLGIGEPDFETPTFVRNAAKRAIDAGYHKYTPNAGMSALKKEIARKLRQENGISVDPETEVLVTAGATQAIFVALHCLLNPGDEVVMPSPLFVAYRQITRIAGGTPIEVPMNEANDYKLDARSLEKKITSRTKLIVINSPCNPTGIVYNRKEIEEVCELTNKCGLYLLSDEIYEKFLYDKAEHFSPASKLEFKNRIITINGFSKTFAMTGWRLGYASANEEIINAMTRYNMYNSVCANSIAQMAGIASLRRSSSFFKPILNRYRRSRAMALELLDKMGLEYATPEGAFYVFPNISKITNDSTTYAKRLLFEENVATIPGSAFGGAGEGHLRISYSIEEKHLEEGMGRIARFNKSFQ